MALDRYELHEHLSTIKMVGTRFERWGFAWKITEASDDDGPGFNIQCSFERPDADTGEMGTGFGRKWFVSATATPEAITMTAWLAMQQIVTHEMMESFTILVPGRGRVRLFDPHKSLVDLTVGSRTI